jgi:hypothetical protein
MAKASKARPVLEWCLYCDGRRETLEESLEHIWPEALGGESGPELFKTRDVCARCNNLSGQWIDGAFLKSFFLRSEISLPAYDYLDPDKPSPMPATYMGTDTEFPCAEGETCELWLGPAGAHIYHVHEKDDGRWTGFAGGDFLKRRRQDPGRAYLLLTTDQEYWAIATLLSFRAQFPVSPRRCLTAMPRLPAALGILRHDEQPLSATERREIDFILGRRSSNRHAQLDIKVDFSDRFLAKLALGFGHTILGPAVSRSPYADALRSRLWSPDETPEEIARIRGTGFWGGKDDAVAARLLGWKGAWTLTFQAMPAAFGLVVCTPGGRMMSMALSDDPSLWSPEISDAYGDGQTYIVVPGRALTVGPVPLSRMIAHELGHKHPELLALEALRTDRSRLPPYRSTPPTEAKPAVTD